MGINYFLNGQKTSKHKMLITFYTVDYFSKLFCRKHSSETGKNEKEEQNSNKPSTTNKTKKKCYEEASADVVRILKPKQKQKCVY